MPRHPVLYTALALCIHAWSTSARAQSHAPAVMLWAWEHPQDLRFLPARSVGVAFFAATVDLVGDTARVVPRRQPLRVNPGTYLVAVVRVEGARRGRSVAHTAAQRAAVVSALRDAASQAGVRGVQIDYDAARSERDFYRALLLEARRALPAPTEFTMTALASWCLADRWLDGLPVADVVPMVFAMGPGGAAVRTQLAAHGEFTAPQCRQSVGLATDEPAPALTPARRRYYFHRGAWSARAFAQLGIPP